MKDIPMPSENIKKDEKEIQPTDDSLRIAFRYEALPKLDAVQRAGSQNQMSYDLTKKYDPEKIEASSNIKYLSFNDYQARKSDKTIFDVIIDDLQHLAQNSKNNLIRVCINSIGSPMWYNENFSTDILKFLVQLKSITRYNNIVCFLTMPLHLVDIVDDQLIYKIRKIIDVNVNLESFDNVDKQTNAVFKQYHGLLHVKKLQTLTALQSYKPEAFDLAFKLKLHRFVIEKLHLPPELQENESSIETSMSCSSSGGNKSLDF
jgi:elongator complex protein 4